MDKHKLDVTSALGALRNAQSTHNGTDSVCHCRAGHRLWWESQNTQVRTRASGARSNTATRCALSVSSSLYAGSNTCTIIHRMQRTPLAPPCCAVVTTAESRMPCAYGASNAINDTQTAKCAHRERDRQGVCVRVCPRCLSCKPLGMLLDQAPGHGTQS